MGDIALKRTTNYSLPTWEKSDFIQMSDFNDLTQKLDAALKSESDARSEADGTASERLTALTQKWGRGKVCRVAWGSYTGAGVYGPSHPNHIACDFTPVLLAIYNSDSNNITPVFAFRDMAEFGFNSSGGVNTITWSEQGVSWYVNGGNTMSVYYQLNTSGNTYHYLIIGYAAEEETEE